MDGELASDPPPEQPIDFDALMEQLTGDLSEKVQPLLGGRVMGLHVAMWVRNNPEWPDAKIPVAGKVSNETGVFAWSPLLSRDLIDAVYRYRIGEDHSRFPTSFLTDGLLQLDSVALRSWTDGFSQLVGAQVPAGNVDGVLDYVRFFLGMVAELLRISGQPPLIARPIETAVSLADSVSGFSVRF